MAYDKYKKLKLQYSYGTGDAWKDANPPRYKAGELIETNSPDCGGVNRLYRWYALPNEFVCDGYNKYYKEVYQVSDDGGKNWINAFPEQSRAGQLIEANSYDCDYGVEWIPVKGQYICATPQPEPPEPPTNICTHTFQLEDIGDKSYIKYIHDGYKIDKRTKQAVDKEYDCKYDLDVVGLKYLELKPYDGHYNISVDTVNYINPTVKLPVPDFTKNPNYCNLTLFPKKEHKYQFNEININWDAIVDCPNMTERELGIGESDDKVGGYLFDLNGIILDDKMINHILYDTTVQVRGGYYDYPYFDYYNFKDRKIKIDGYDYRLCRTGKKDFSIYPDYFFVPFYYKSNFEKRVELTNFRIANSYTFNIGHADYVLIDNVNHDITIDDDGNPDAPINASIIIHATKEVILRNITFAEGNKDNWATDNFRIYYPSSADGPSETYIELENINIPIQYIYGEGKLVPYSSENRRYKIHMTNCSEAVQILVNNSLNEYVELV